MIGRERDGRLTVYVGVTTVHASAKLFLHPNGTMKVEVMEGVREFELSAEEVGALHLELTRQEQDRRSGISWQGKEEEG